MVSKLKQSVSNVEKRVEKKFSTAVSINEIVERKFRFEAAAYSVPLRASLKEIRHCGLKVKAILDGNKFGVSATNAFRFKRHYVEREKGMPFLSSSNIIELRPKPEKFLSKALTKNLDDLLVGLHDILISCSGTIGNVSLAGKSIEGLAISQHVIRLQSSDSLTAGYVTAFLRSSYGRIQLTQSSYGSVVTHIEPDHLANIAIPDPHPIVLSAIGKLMVDACEKRDKANSLLDEADKLLKEVLDLPPLSTLEKRTKNKAVNVIKASQLSWRFEASYHNPVAEKILATLKRKKINTINLDDASLTKEIRPITKFRKRVYVPEGGIPLLSSKQLFQIDPIEIKRLAKGAHNKDLEEIALEANMIVVTRSGTIGRVGIIPEYMAGWAGSEHATRIIGINDIMSGYLYAWLASDYGKLLITRYSYGSVILEIDKEMLSSIPVPVIDEKEKNKIGNLVLKANKLRAEAWDLERDAIKQVEDLVANQNNGVRLD